MSNQEENNFVTKVITSELFKVITTLAVFTSLTSWNISNLISNLKSDFNNGITELRLQIKDIKYTNELSNNLMKQRVDLLEKEYKQDYEYLEKRLSEIKNEKK